MALTDSSPGRIIFYGTPEGGFNMDCAERVYAGDLLGISATGTVVPVDSDDAQHGRLVAGGNGATGDPIPCYVMAVIGGFTGGTEGAAVYPSGTAGQYTETVDTDSGDSNEIVGYVLSESEILVTPIRADSTA